jgi:hypothetical protein
MKARMKNDQPISESRTSTRKTLNKKQLQILYLLYKFRFGTTELFTKCQSNKVSRQYVNKRLSILCGQEYIGRKYDGSYRLAGKPAVYYLLPKGIKLLRQRPDDFNPKILKNISNDYRAGVRFSDHSIQVFNAYCYLKARYGENLKYFTTSYLKLPQYDYFPQPLPDAYVSLNGESSSHYFLEYFESITPFFVIKKRLKYYVSYAEDNLWPKSTMLPTIVIVCDTESLQKRVEIEIRKSIERTWKDLVIVAVTMTELDNSNFYLPANGS